MLGITLLAWSKRVFGLVLPGIVGYLSFLSYYLSLDYSLAAQRDLHAPLLAVLAILVLQASKGGSLTPAFSGIATAMALTIRPQAVLFLPAIAIQLLGEMRSGTTSRRLWVWVVSLTVAILLLFTPLVMSGIVPDFLDGIGHNYAARQGRLARLLSILVVFLGQLGPFGNIAVCLAVFALPKPDRKHGQVAMVWIAALLLVLFYKPISPTPHHYLNIPLTMVLAVNMAVVTQLLLAVDRLAPFYKLLSFALLLGVSCKMRPDFSPSGRVSRPRRTRYGASQPPAGPWATPEGRSPRRLIIGGRTSEPSSITCVATLRRGRRSRTPSRGTPPSSAPWAACRPSRPRASPGSRWSTRAARRPSPGPSSMNRILSSSGLRTTPAPIRHSRSI